VELSLPGAKKIVLILGCLATLGVARGEITPVMTDITAGLQVVDEIDPATTMPVYESAPGVSQVRDILGRRARVLPPGDKAEAIAYVIGEDKGLAPNRAYILTVDYPDDVPRSVFMANRGADYVRAWSTGTAWGEICGQYTAPSLESLNYPQSGQWQTYKEFFCLMNRFQGVKNDRDPKPGDRPFVPADGFHVVIFQSKKLDDPRSEGAAIGKIRLYAVDDPAKLNAPIHYPPQDLPKRRIFNREEMADEAIAAPGKDNACDDSLDWFRAKLKMARVLGINTFAKDLLEYGFNQDWETGNVEWMNEGDPPNRDLWTRLVPMVAAEGFEIIPYYEYAGALGLHHHSFGEQRRAQKLYHGLRKRDYSSVSWAENFDVDLTDPDTLQDFERMLDKTVVRFKDQAKFPAIWLRTRYTELPISFSPATIARFKADFPHDEQAQTADQKNLIASYEGDKVLYRKYLDWWFGKRAAYLTALRDYLRQKLGRPDTQILFTAWPAEPIPLARPDAGDLVGIVTDDPGWWENFLKSVNDDFYKKHLAPTSYQTVLDDHLYSAALRWQHPVQGEREEFHAAPVADPARYKNIEGIMMTYPIGRIFAASNAAAMDDFRAPSGLTVVRHYSLNEDHVPFDNVVGYIAADADHAGPNLMLGQARAVAYGDPFNLAYLNASSFSTGFPEIMRRFNQAFLAVPALPSKRLDAASSDPEIVVREISTPTHGTYYYVVNTSMRPKTAVTVKFPAPGTMTNQVTGEKQKDGPLKLDLDAAELRAYLVAPNKAPSRSD